MDLPSSVMTVFYVLEQHNKEIYLVGGCVRDMFLDRVAKDYDFATSAEPEETMNIFKKSGYRVIPTGIDFGTVTVLVEDQSFEITTFRSDGDYIDGRRPSGVEFSKSIDEDLKRRDFTMNALAYNPKTGVIDNHMGLMDLKSGMIKAVGDADERLREDFLRAFRAVRFSNQLEMRLEKPIKNAIETHIGLIENVSKERVNVELTKTLLSGNPLRYVRLMSLLLRDVLPELYDSFNIEQKNPYHSYNVGEHTIKVVDNVENEITLKLTALLHDMGKPECKFTDEEGVDHFYGHHKASQRIAERFLSDLKYSNDVIEKVTTLIYYHDRQIEATEKSVKRVLNKLGSEMFLELLKIKDADIQGQNPDYFHRAEHLRDLRVVYNEIIEQDQCFSLKDLALNGRDIIAIGVPVGKKIGIVLDMLLDKVIDNAELNNKETLTEIVVAFIKKGDMI